MKIKNIDNALALYEKHNIIRGEALEEGNSSKANYHCDKISEIIDFLKKEDALPELFRFLEHSNPGLRLTTAVKMKDYDENTCLEVAKSIEKNEKGTVSLDANLCIKVFWEKSHPDSDKKRITIKKKKEFIVCFLAMLVLAGVIYFIYPSWWAVLCFTLSYSTGLINRYLE